MIGSCDGPAEWEYRPLDPARHWEGRQEGGGQQIIQVSVWEREKERVYVCEREIAVIVSLSENIERGRERETDRIK